MLKSVPLSPLDQEKGVEEIILTYTWQCLIGLYDNLSTRGFPN